MDQSVTTIQHQAPRYGHHVRTGKMHRPHVFRTEGGYKIVPWNPLGKEVWEDDFLGIVEDTKPSWLQLLEIVSMIVLPVYLVLAHFNGKRYARKFWIKNGFDPDSFASYY